MKRILKNLNLCTYTLNNEISFKIIVEQTRKSKFKQKDHFDTSDTGDEEDADEFIGERCKSLLMYSITCLSANTTLC